MAKANPLVELQRIQDRLDWEWKERNLPNIDYEMVDEIPERMKPSSQYDPVADTVRKTGRVAKITSSEGSLHTLASRLRGRYPDLEIKARTTEDGFFVFISPKPNGKGSK